ncbi:MAG TPA: enoyl-CoA hydratase-related protein [Euzebyales bacterium]
MGDAPIRTAHDGRVHTITLASPHNRNALSRPLLTGLRTALGAVAADDQAQLVVLRAEGPAFCAGADLQEAAAADAAAQAATSDRMLGVLRAIVTLPVPVLAVVHGPVRAGGIGLVAACDLAVASADATFAAGEVRLGLAPAVISTVVVPRLSDRDASLLLLGAGTIAAPEAAEVGLVTAAVPPHDLDAKVADVIEQLCASPRQGLVATKRLLNRSLVARIDADGPAMAELSANLFQSEVAQSRFRQFLGG